jgi:hypothetical protein
MAMKGLEAGARRMHSLWRAFAAAQPGAEVISASNIQRVRARPPLLEVKHKIGRSPQSFALEEWGFFATGPAASQACVGRYVIESGNPYGAAGGSYSWGVWWPSQSYGAYRLHDPFGNRLAYRLDLLSRVALSVHPDHKQVEFHDLVIDVWLFPQPNSQQLAAPVDDIIVEDLDEFQSCREQGLLSDPLCLQANAALSDILENPHSVLQRIDTTIDRACHQVRSGSS